MNKHFSDNFWMLHALKLSERAQISGEIPVGAVLVLNNEIIGEGWNCSISHNDPTAHAEIMALRQGGWRIGNYRLLNTVMYITLEPCLMCTGAMIHARIARLVFGASEKKTGAARLLLDEIEFSKINHKIKLTRGVLSEVCSTRLNNFFRYRRKLKKYNKQKLPLFLDSNSKALT